MSCWYVSTFLPIEWCPSFYQIPKTTGRAMNPAQNSTKSPAEPLKFALFPWLKSRFKYFCSVTALHGCNHIVRKDTPRWERIVWMFVVGISLLASIILLRISWIWNSEFPVVTVIESTHYATWNIPFPAVTVCNLNKISMSAALKFASTL